MYKTIYTKITTRLWFNPQFGKGIGPKRKNNVIYNGSVSFEKHGIKSWVDLAGLDHIRDSFHHLGYTSFADSVYDFAGDIGYTKDRHDDFVAGQLISATKPKQFADGFVIADMQRLQMIVYLDRDPDPHFALLPIICACGRRSQTTKSPDFLATNFDLEPQKTPAPTTSSIGTKLDVSARLNALISSQQA